MKKKNIFSRMWHWFKGLSKFKKILILLLLCALAFGAWKLFFTPQEAPLDTTAPVKKGDIVDQVEASGPIAPVNTTSGVLTGAMGPEASTWSTISPYLTGAAVYSGASWGV